MVVITKLEGASELRTVLRKLPDRTQKRVLQAAARKGANVIRDAAIARAPVGMAPHPRVGHLRDNIKVTAGRGNTSKGVTLIVHIGRAFWGLFTEFGTSRQAARPFMRPALDEHGDEAIRAVGKALGRGVEREADKIAGPYLRARKVL